MPILLEYLHLYNAKLANLQFSNNNFPNFHLFSRILFFAFGLLKLSWQNWHSPNGQGGKSCDIKGGSQEMAVMV